MIQPVVGIKRKRIDAQAKTEGRKRTVIRNGESASLDIGDLERRLGEDPAKNQKDVETLLGFLDLSNPDAKSNLKVGIILCKVFSRLAASGDLTTDNQGRKQNREMSDWYLQQYGRYRKTLMKLLRSVSAPQRLPIVHVCWKILEVDAELLDNSLWTSESMFKMLLTAVVEISDGIEIREAYVGEYVNQCHDCCYYSLEYFSWVYPLVVVAVI